MRKTILTAGLLLGALNQAGCGGMAKHSSIRPQISNKPVLRELNQSINNTCEISTNTSYKIINRKPNPRQRYNGLFTIQDIAQITIPLQEINNCVRNVIRGAEIQFATTQDENIEFTLGENSDLNIDLISIYSEIENQNLSDHIECTTADFSGYFVRGIVCNHYDLNPLEKSTISNTFERHGFNVNLSEKQLIATKNNN